MYRSVGVYSPSVVCIKLCLTDVQECWCVLAQCCMHQIVLYFCSQRENAQRQSEGRCHLRLHTAGYQQEEYVERVQLALPSSLPLEATLQLNVCPTFAVSGCQLKSCGPAS